MTTVREPSRISALGDEGESISSSLPWTPCELPLLPGETSSSWMTQYFDNLLVHMVVHNFASPTAQPLISGDLGLLFADHQGPMQSSSQTTVSPQELMWSAGTQQPYTSPNISDEFLSDTYRCTTSCQDNWQPPNALLDAHDVSKDTSPSSFSSDVEKDIEMICTAFYEAQGTAVDDTPMPLLPVLRCRITTCGLTFTTRKELSSHLAEAHSATVYRCEWKGPYGTRKQCGKSFRGNHDLRRHLTAHYQNTNLVCSYVGCERKFMKQATLNRHVKVDHLDMLPYCCHELRKNGKPCKAKFDRPWRLTRHPNTLHSTRSK